MARRREDTLAAVPLAQQAGDDVPHPVWLTAKPCVWTVRMLTTLVTGVEGGKWFRLYDKVFSERNLFAAFQQVAKNDGAPGVDHVSVTEFGQQIPENLWQLSGNVYLDPLDHFMAASGIEMVRYADDFVVLCRTREAADAALSLIQTWVAEAGLTLHARKTRIVDTRVDSIAFLGYEFRGEKHWPRKKSVQKLKDSLRRKTRRSTGQSLQCVIVQLNQTLGGWFGYFQHSSYRTVFQDLDQWLRGGHRSILRKRRGGRGRGRGKDHLRWRNRYFADLGLFSLVAAHVAACQS